MKYISTRGNYQQVSAAEAIRQGMVPTGGLFVPEEIPCFTFEEIVGMQNNNYQEIAYLVLKRFLTDYTTQELKDAISAAYNKQNFPVKEIAPLFKLTEYIHILELWHGPTAAFKDMALQLMPYLLVQALNKVDLNKEIVILVATSGDTGKAALEGFKDIEGVRIIVFYPNQGVSKVQEVQMVTTGGNNTAVVAVKGNFDDCQNSVKEVFGDQEFNKVLSENGYQFSSANSINWGRLVPQIIYYFTAYAFLLRKGEISEGEKINIAVPTGNFGNILAAYYACRMGLPVNRFICASNDNKVLTDFLKTGEYDKNREFRKTTSPSMDILISSNLERFLFEMTDHNADKINNWYRELKEKGKFKIDENTRLKIASLFTGEWASEEDTKKTIKEIFDRHHYTLDTHTAVGVKAYYKYLEENEDNTTTIIDSTASPYKFSKAVLAALQDKFDTDNEFEILEILNEKTGQEIHRGLQNLSQKDVRHNRGCLSTEIRNEIKDLLGIID